METHPLQASLAWKSSPHWAEPNGLIPFKSLNATKRTKSKHFRNKEHNVVPGVLLDSYFYLLYSKSLYVWVQFNRKRGLKAGSTVH